MTVVLRLEPGEALDYGATPAERELRRRRYQIKRSAPAGTKVAATVRPAPAPPICDHPPALNWRSVPADYRHAAELAAAIAGKDLGLPWRVPVAFYRAPVGSTEWGTVSECCPRVVRIRANRPDGAPSVFASVAHELRHVRLILDRGWPRDAERREADEQAAQKYGRNLDRMYRELGEYRLKRRYED